MARQTASEALKDWAKLTEQDIGEIERVQRQQRTDFLSAALESGLLDEQAYLDFLAQRLSLPCVCPDLLTISKETLGLLSLELCRKYQVLPFYRLDQDLFIATCDPENILALDDIRFVTGLELIVHVASPRAISCGLEAYANQGRTETDLTDLDQALAEIDETGQGPQDPGSLEEPAVLEAAAQAPVVKMVNLIIMDALRKKASDIHIEPYEDVFRVRLRIDGVLQETMRPPKRLRNAIISRLKIMAHMDIAEKRLPQDGRAKAQVPSGQEVEFRVSVLPMLHGEKVVLRILDKSSLNLDLRELGLEGRTLRTLHQAIKVPSGMVLVTGPTGSGKTTTLYSAIMELNDQRVNIATAEDPVEYSLEGVNQVQVREDIGLSFANVLRSFLRQDPDIILVGEIRDLVTAEIAIKAAMTGHLVLSTLHTNDAPRALVRLLDMGVAEYLISSALNAVVAQRLVRRLCPYCKVQTRLSRSQLESLGVGPGPRGFEAYSAKGCSRCNHTGYKGRVGLYEVLKFSDRVRRCLQQGGSVFEIQETALAEGMVTMRQSGVQKIRQGITSVQEVIRATAGPDPGQGDDFGQGPRPAEGP